VLDLIGAELARKVGFLVPELVFANLAEGFGRTEPDEEIQDLFKFSTGLNLGVHYLSGSITFDAVLNRVEPEVAAKIVWLDAFLMNIDRTARNTNMLFWNKELWLIDQGASLYFHHNPENWEEQAAKPFVQIKDHVLLSQAADISSVHDFMMDIMQPSFIAELVENIPADSLSVDDSIRKKLYVDFFKARLQHADTFLKEAENARKALI
jgi:hypothetical protein